MENVVSHTASDTCSRSATVHFIHNCSAWSTCTKAPDNGFGSTTSLTLVENPTSVHTEWSATVLHRYAPLKSVGIEALWTGVGP